MFVDDVNLNLFYKDQINWHFIGILFQIIIIIRIQIGSPYHKCKVLTLKMYMNNVVVSYKLHLK